MPTENGATNLHGAKERLTTMFQKPELERPTGEGENPSQDASPELSAQMADEPAEISDEVSETLQSDTEEISKRFKAKLGDREVEFELLTDDVDIDLIPKGLMMEADYRKKTMETADLRKSLEGKQQELDARFNEAAELIQFEIDNLDSQEMTELKNYDPESYWKKVDQIKSRGEKLKSWREEKQKEIDARNKSLVEREQERLTQLIPDWLDDGQKAKDVERLQGTLKDMGFDENEIAALGAPYDSRLLVMARKAMLYDDLQSKDIESKRVKTKPKAVEPSGGQQTRSEDEAVKRTKQRLKKTGNVRDAQKALRDLMNFK